MKKTNSKALNKKAIIIAAVVAAVAVIAAAGLISGITLYVSDGKEVDRVESLIAAIGEVTLDKEEAIDEAEKAFDALKGRQQKRVSNKDLLLEAMIGYDILYFNGKSAELSEAIDKSLTEYGMDSSNIEGLYTELSEIYNGADDKTKEQLKGFGELKDKKAALDEALAKSQTAAVSYVRGFLEVNQDKNIKITEISAIVHKSEETVYHLFALRYTEDGEEKTVYAKARFADAPSLETMLNFADNFYCEEPAAETHDALKYGNVKIDIEKVLSELK